MPTDSGPEPKPIEILHVVILREMWGEFFTLQMDNGQTEELEPEEIRLWFKVRGADMDKMERVFDHVWNFGRAEVEIENPKTPPVTRLPYAPDI